MLLWAFRVQLEGVLGFRIESALSLSVETWHWIVGWSALWFLLSTAAQQIVGTSRGAVLSGSLAMAIGGGTWLVVHLGKVEPASLVTIGSVLIAFWGGWIMVQFARLRLIMQARKAEAATRGHRQNPDIRRNDLTEHFIYVFVSLVGLGIVASQFVWPDTELDHRRATGVEFSSSLVFVILIMTS